MESLEKDNWKENDKFLNNTLLWIKAHPDRNVKFNNQLKPIRREILDNLKWNIDQGNWRSIDAYSLNSYFWAYFEKGKNMPISDIFKDINVRFDDGNNMNLANYFKILNLIRLNVNWIIVDVQSFKKTFFIDDDQPVYSVWEYSLNIDNQMTKYNSFLRNRFFQYNLAIKDWSYKLKNIIYCYVLKNKFKNSDFFDFSQSKSVIYQDWISIKLNILSQIVDIIGIWDNSYIAKKI